MGEVTKQGMAAEEAGFVDVLFVVAPRCAQSHTIGCYGFYADKLCEMIGGGFHLSFLASMFQLHT